METAKFLQRVAKSLGRDEPLRQAPVPPAIDEPIVRLVHSDIGLGGLFAKMAGANKILAEVVHTDSLHERLVAFLAERNVRTVAIAATKLIRQLQIAELLKDRGIQLKAWTEMTLDELYDVDCSITDAYAGVAETGSIVVRESANHGRALSLVPPIHVAILEPRVLVPDLVDLFDKLAREGTGSGVVLITGPSKTADIEMNLVQGVHGPGVVKAFVLK